MTFTREERERFLESLIRESEVVEITAEVQACRDPKDDRILELAVNGNATTVVTGDDDLLVWNPSHGIPSVTPAVLLQNLDTRSSENETEQRNEREA